MTGPTHSRSSASLPQPVAIRACVESSRVKRGPGSHHGPTLPTPASGDAPNGPPLVLALVSLTSPHSCAPGSPQCAHPLYRLRVAGSSVALKYAPHSSHLAISASPAVRMMYGPGRSVPLSASITWYSQSHIHFRSRDVLLLNFALLAMSIACPFLYIGDTPTPGARLSLSALADRPLVSADDLAYRFGQHVGKLAIA
jgi:hypothetical protein